MLINISENLTVDTNISVISNTKSCVQTTSQLHGSDFFCRVIVAIVKKSEFYGIRFLTPFLKKGHL
jgi:hypothetical protein